MQTKKSQNHTLLHEAILYKTKMILLVLACIMLVLLLLPAFWYNYILRPMPTEDLLSDDNLRLALVSHLIVIFCLFFLAFLRLKKNFLCFVIALIMFIVAINNLSRYSRARTYVTDELTKNNLDEDQVLQIYHGDLSRVLSSLYILTLLFIMYLVCSIA